jgi:hypothetical protein
VKEEWPQRTPLGSYYKSIIQEPPPYPFEEKPEEPPNSADPEVLPDEKKPDAPAAPRPAKKKPGRKPKNGTSTASASATPTPPQPSVEASPVPSPPPTTAQEKARIVFGTRLAGPSDRAERLKALKNRSDYIGGVLVPPMPEEPDNCCMSGCVNCVWDLFREDMEEYTAKKSEGEARLKAARSMDADGGGSQGGLGVNVGDTKIAKDLWDDDVFKNVPVGIREFMKQEKRLKEQHEREGTRGST